jgi:hypothetical protein
MPIPDEYNFYLPPDTSMSLTPEQIKAFRQYDNEVAIAKGKAIIERQVDLNARRAFLQKQAGLRFDARGGLHGDHTDFTPNNPNSRTFGKYAGLGGIAVGGGLTAIDAVNRRNENFTDFYNREKRDPSTLEDYGLRIKSGLEPALNMATFGMYDYFGDTPTYRAGLDYDAKMRGWRNENIQEPIDYPMRGGYRTERTTK